MQNNLISCHHNDHTYFFIFLPLPSLVPTFSLTAIVHWAKRSRRGGSDSWARDPAHRKVARAAVAQAGGSNQRQARESVTCAGEHKQGGRASREEGNSQEGREGGSAGAIVSTGEETGSQRRTLASQKPGRKEPNSRSWRQFRNESTLTMPYITWKGGWVGGIRQ